MVGIIDRDFDAFGGGNPRDEEMDAFRRVFSAISKAKATLVERGITAGKITCPECGVKGALVVRMNCAGRRNHVHARCVTPGCALVVME